MGKKKNAPVKVAPVEPKVGLGGTTFGGFQDPGYITIEDDFVKKSEVLSRHGGENMKTNPPKKGKGREAYFDQEVRLLEEKFYDPGKSDVEKKHREGERKRILAGPWKLPNPAKMATGAGSFVGTFYEKAPPPHEQDYDVTKKGDKPEPPKQQRVNVKIGSQKTGGFGMVGGGIYFSNPEPPKDGKGDPYDYHKTKERDELQAQKKKDISLSAGGKTFRATAKSKTTFDEADATGISKIYSADKPLPPIKDKGGKEKDKTLNGPFKYTNATRRGEDGNLNRWTKRDEGKADPYDSYQMKVREEKKKAPKAIGPVWKNNGGPKQGCTRSLLKRFY
eukprot:TRINITY_DN22298_c0_g1_i1.p1 TRINITY_DN22298_c0_g1~~TRINITY_DN22298_c0_g1_i1.p1  ORF type:complete len:334 (+),score=150.90 TRINITY_DN22298_c0_g1_i1:103-1104(+)